MFRATNRITGIEKTRTLRAHLEFGDESAKSAIENGSRATGEMRGQASPTKDVEVIGKQRRCLAPKKGRRPERRAEEQELPVTTQVGHTEDGLSH